MNRTLGLDLGSNSLGWAILDNLNGSIVDKGVVVFPEGVDLDAGTSLETPAAVRRAARMARRMKFRRKLRKWHLLKLLIGARMCPLTEAELETWKKTGKYPLGNKDFVAWLKATDTENPYCDRAAAAQGKVPLFALGRALYHICQRRGFKSSRKEEAAQEDGESGETKNADKKLGAVKTDIAALSEEIKAAGAKTLGEYFYKLMEDNRDRFEKRRIRCRYTGRVEQYEDEFNVIMDAQGYRREDQLRTDLFKAIFLQRPLRSQKHLVGNCPLEPSRPRAQIGHPAFEEYRMLAFVNNLSFDRPDGERVELTPEDRALACTAFMKASPTIKFADVSKLFKKDARFKDEGYEFHYYRPDDTVSTCMTRHKIRSAFGPVAYDEQTVFDAIMFYDDSALLAGWFRTHYPALDEKSVGKLVGIHPKEGNAQYSLKAINRILPFLRMGFELSQARFYAKLPDVIPDFAAHRDDILRNLQEILFACRREKDAYAELDAAQRKLSKVPEALFDRYKTYLLENWNVLEEAFDRLYLRGESQYAPETEYKSNGKVVKLARPRLPPVQLGMIRNPLVQRAMTTLRRLVNYLGEHDKIDPSDTIRIELARSVNDFATRKAWQLWQKKRQQLNDEARVEIEKLGIQPTDGAIERYVLWSEQDRTCLYTGRAIGVQDLFSGNSFDVEHTLPRSLSGDDSLANKTICDATYNRQVKRGNVPRNCPNWDEIDVHLTSWRRKVECLQKDFRNQSHSARGRTDPVQKSQARVKALLTRFELVYWRDKLRRFEMTVDKLQVREGELGGFKKRQLVDTGIMCSHAVDLLKSVYPATFSVNGAATAFARKAWGIQGDGGKDRTEHTHHAKDAMVIAALTPARFTAICTALKDDGRMEKRECDVCPPPYEGFHENVRRSCDEILVKHVLRQTTLRQSSKRTALAHKHPLKADPSQEVKYVKAQGDTIRGQLHLDTFYGCIKKPGEEAPTFVVRKSLIGKIADAQSLVDKIVDPAIRELVEKRLADLKDGGAKSVEPGDIKMPSGVPVNKVRIVAQTTNPAALRDHAMPSDKEYKTPYYVVSAPGSNFRLALFDKDGKMSVEPADNSLTWAQNHKKDDFVPWDKMPGFVGYIMPGSMALTYHEGHPDELRSLSAAELGKRLYKVVKFESSGRMTLRRHIEARASTVLAADLVAKGLHKNGESQVSFEEPSALLYLSAGSLTKCALFEGIHFKMMIDGSIKFM